MADFGSQGQANHFRYMCNTQPFGKVAALASHRQAKKYDAILGHFDDGVSLLPFDTSR